MSACGRESEVLAAVRQGQWPAALDPALRAHVNACAACREVVVVASALGEARTQGIRNAHVAQPGILFWKAQLRRRNQAVERMTQPIVIAEIVAIMLTAMALVVTGWRWAQTVDVNWAAKVGMLAGAAQSSMWVMVAALAALGAFAVVALYWLVARE